MGTSFLPSLRPDVRVRTTAVVNLTLNTLYEVMEWLPSQPRTSQTEPDDWKWTLRSAANRPLLRWLEDGPLVVVSDESGKSRRLKARLMASGQQGSFGESGERVSATVEETPANSRALLAQVDFDPASDAGIESMLGFRQDLGFAGSVETVGSVAIRPEIMTDGSQGLDEASVRTLETINLGDMLEAEAGSTEVLARFGDNSPNTILAALPFATVAWRNGDATIRYRMATSIPGRDDEGDAAMPALAMRDGQLALEHGLHQEIGWERRTDNSDAAVMVFSDRVRNPAIEAMASPAMANSAMSYAAGGVLLFDPESGLVRAAGPGFSSVGVAATVQHRLPKGNQVRLSYANGNALVMGAAPQQAALAQVLASARARHAQTYTISLSRHSGWQWNAVAGDVPLAAGGDHHFCRGLLAAGRRSLISACGSASPIHIRRDTTLRAERF